MGTLFLRSVHEENRFDHPGSVHPGRTQDVNTLKYDLSFPQYDVPDLYDSLSPEDDDSAADQALPGFLSNAVKQQPNDIRLSAIALLARREHSQKELLTKLSRKYSDHSLIKKEIDALASEGLQSEERFVELFIRSKKAQGKGPIFIKQDLRRRGVSEYLIASYIYDNDEDWLSLARNVYRKKYGFSAVEDSLEKARRIRFMVSRGFPPDSVFRLLDGKDDF